MVRALTPAGHRENGVLPTINSLLPLFRYPRGPKGRSEGSQAPSR